MSKIHIQIGILSRQLYPRRYRVRLVRGDRDKPIGGRLCPECRSPLYHPATGYYCYDLDCDWWV